MKKLTVLLAAALAAVLIYAVTAPAGGEAVTPKQIKALQAQIKALQKRTTTIEQVLGLCFHHAVQVTQYSNYQQSGQTTARTGLDVTAGTDKPTAYLLDVGSDCATAVNQGARALLRSGRR